MTELEMLATEIKPDIMSRTQQQDDWVPDIKLLKKKTLQYIWQKGHCVFSQIRAKGMPLLCHTKDYVSGFFIFKLWKASLFENVATFIPKISLEFLPLA